jgi:hypothetical protein
VLRNPTHAVLLADPSEAAAAAAYQTMLVGRRGGVPTPYRQAYAC